MSYLLQLADIIIFCFVFALSGLPYRLRGTSTGANNRMDLLTLVTSGMDNSEVRDPEEDILGVVERWRDDETHNPDVPAVSHKRGLTPFIFVPFEQVIAAFAFRSSSLRICCIGFYTFWVTQVETSELNLPVEKMDYFVPG